MTSPLQRPLIRRTTSYLLAVVVMVLSACSTLDQEGVSARKLTLNQLPGWQQDSLIEVWSAFLKSCIVLRNGTNRDWLDVCQEAQLIRPTDEDVIRAFLETRFFARQLLTEENLSKGLITGYYEPLLLGSFTKTSRFRYPIYKKPRDLLTVELQGLYPELQGRPVRARLKGKRVVPYYSRSEIHDGRNPLAGHELLWVDNIVDLFFLHVQGSGRVRLTSGKEVRVGYSDQNGHPYESLGGQLVRLGALELEQVNLYSIKSWLAQNPKKVQHMLNKNPSYIFFDIKKEKLGGPIGSLGVPLTAERSIAIDQKYVSLGSPVWLSTKLPGEQGNYQRLMMSQDTGGAIKGSIRADVFFGKGKKAEELAGHMKQEGELFVLYPHSQKYKTRYVHQEF